MFAFGFVAPRVSRRKVNQIYEGCRVHSPDVYVECCLHCAICARCPAAAPELRLRRLRPVLLPCRIRPLIAPRLGGKCTCSRSCRIGLRGLRTRLSYDRTSPSRQGPHTLQVCRVLALSSCFLVRGRCASRLRFLLLWLSRSHPVWCRCLLVFPFRLRLLQCYALLDVTGLVLGSVTAGSAGGNLNAQPESRRSTELSVPHPRCISSRALLYPRARSSERGA